MNKLLPLLTTLVQVARPWRPGAVVLIAILAAVLFTGPPASAQSGSAGVVEMGLAQVGIEVSAVLNDDDGHVRNEAWQWQRSATEYGTYTDIPAVGRGHLEPVHSLGGRSGHVAQGKGHLRCPAPARARPRRGPRSGRCCRKRPCPTRASLTPTRVGLHLRLVPARARTVYAQGFTTGPDTSGYLLTAVRLSLFATRTLRVRGVGGACRRQRQAGTRAAFGCSQPIPNADIPRRILTGTQEFTHPDGVQSRTRHQVLGSHLADKPPTMTGTSESVRLGRMDRRTRGGVGHAAGGPGQRGRLVGGLHSIDLLLGRSRRHP